MTDDCLSLGRRIVVGIDGSKRSAAVLEWATSQARLSATVLEVVTVWERSTNPGWELGIPDTFDPAAEPLAMHHKLLDPMKAAHPDVTVHSSVIEGRPALLLVEASLGADLLVVGRTGHGEFVGMLLGSVSEHCVHHASCSVVVIR
jgi:nucleotide-binding universal stress UspA family protein